MIHLVQISNGKSRRVAHRRGAAPSLPRRRSRASTNWRSTACASQARPLTEQPLALAHGETLDYDEVYSGTSAWHLLAPDRRARRSPRACSSPARASPIWAARRSARPCTSPTAAKAPSRNRQHAHVPVGRRGRTPRRRRDRHRARVVLQGQRRRSCAAPSSHSTIPALRGRRRRRGRGRRHLPHRRRRHAVPHRHGDGQRVLRPQIREAQLPQPRRLEAAHLQHRPGARRRRAVSVRPGRSQRSSAAPVRSGQKTIETGEANMCHSLANMEHHHFKFEAHRQPGDVHVHFYGAHSLSFGEGIELEDGDWMRGAASRASAGRCATRSASRQRTTDRLVAVRSLA